MNTKIGLFVTLVALSGLGIGAFAQQNSTASNVEGFKIEIGFNPTSSSIKMKCIEGCVWETLAFTCDSSVECTSSIDEGGMSAE